MNLLNEVQALVFSQLSNLSDLVKNFNDSLYKISLIIYLISVWEKMEVKNYRIGSDIPSQLLPTLGPVIFKKIEVN